MSRSPSGVSDASATFNWSGAARDAAGGLPSDNWTPHRPDRQWEKIEGGKRFRVASDYEPAGDQRTAIPELVEGIENGERDQVLLGATGTGKTFTMAKVIEAVQRPALILAPNKTLAAQLYGEMKSFFPDNAVEYFVSYYDYYQPEAYVPRSDLYIEKESSINEAIDRMRHSATRAILERDDVIIVASVSCIYGIGSVETYTSMTFKLEEGQQIDPREVTQKLVALQYTRNDAAFQRGTFRLKGDVLDIFPAHYDDCAWKLSFFGDELESIVEFDPLTGKKIQDLPAIKLYANSHYVTPRPTLNNAVNSIKKELKETIEHFEKHNKLLEAQRIEQRVTYDMEMMAATGSCNGIENYSRYLTGRLPGEPPPTMFEYLPENALVFVDESHQTVPQIGAMFKGDFNRKSTLAEYGFRLPSCIDNRPLKFPEWEAMRPQTVHVSATPGKWELEQTGGVFTEQVIRPTGLIDPPVEVRPVTGTKDNGNINQVDDLLAEVKETAAKGFRSLVTTLTKKMAEDLTEYLHEQGVKVRYMHSDIDTIARGVIAANKGTAKVSATELLDGASPGKHGVTLLPPVDAPEVWAFGVTYMDSMRERQAESGSPDVYAKIYDADRPEAFFKSTFERLQAPFDEVGIRGEFNTCVMEYGDGFMVVSVVTADALITVVVRSGTNVGGLLYELRRYRTAIAELL